MASSSAELEVSIEALRANITSLQALHESILTALDDQTATVSNLNTDLDSMWLIIGGILVFFMQGGFAMLEIGNSPVRATKNMLLKNVLDSCVACIGWYTIGFGIAFGANDGNTGSKVSGTENFFLKGEKFGATYGDYGTAEGYNWAYWFFQYAFCGAATTIISGAVGVRITLMAYFSVSLIMSSFIYAIYARWMWSVSGWLSPWRSDELLFGCGAIDFAGSGVVHMVGGVAALTLCWIIGPRLGRFVDGEAMELPKQSAVLQVMGLFILWTGWYGFNSVSTLYLVGFAHVSAKVCVTTTISASTSAVAAAALAMLTTGRVSHEEVINGILGGLVAITSGCAVVEPEGAFVIGVVAAPIFMWGVKLLIWLKIDDSVDAIPVHLFCGIWGVIAPGLLTTKEAYSQAYFSDRAENCCGALYGCGHAQLAAQVVAVAMCFLWVGSSTFVFGSLLNALGILRISKKAEAIGIDETHGGAEVPEHIRDLLKQLEEDQDESSAASHLASPKSAPASPTGGKGGGATATNGGAGGGAVAAGCDKKKSFARSQSSMKIG